MVRSIIVFGLLLGSAFAQSVTFANLDDALTGWQYNPPCVGANCAGGSGLPTATGMTIVKSPSQDGTAAQFSMTAPMLSNKSWTTNVLWPRKIGANNSYTSFSCNWDVYLPNLANLTALEFDCFQFNRGQRYMFGSECDQDGIWKTWNQLTVQWVVTSVPCSLFTTNAWHSVTWQVHRVPGETTCAGNPCMYYDSLTVDGTRYAAFAPQPSAPSADPDNNGIQFQIDENYLGGAATVYADGVNFTVSTPPAAPVLGSATTN